LGALGPETGVLAFWLATIQALVKKTVMELGIGAHCKNKNL
jgi:hypothetical protein